MILTGLSEIDPGPHCPETVRMIVEIGKNSSNKYEYDSELGVFRFDRALYSPMHYPGDYGFVPGTIAEDGDPIDVINLVDHPSFPGCLTEVRPVGMLEMVDEAEIDHKILAVPVRNPRFDQVRNLDDLPDHVRVEVEHFFEIYKELEGRTVKTRGWRGLDEARDAIAKSRERFLATRGNSTTVGNRGRQ
jgi:inorganic pyrophosphatase